MEKQLKNEGRRYLIGHVSHTKVEEWKVVFDDVAHNNLQLGLKWSTLYAFLQFGNHPGVNLTGYHFFGFF